VTTLRESWPSRVTAQITLVCLTVWNLPVVLMCAGSESHHLSEHIAPVTNVVQCPGLPGRGHCLNSWIFPINSITGNDVEARWTIVPAQKTDGFGARTLIVVSVTKQIGRDGDMTWSVRSRDACPYVSAIVGNTFSLFPVMFSST